jgi:exosome complex component RRP43
MDAVNPKLYYEEWLDNLHYRKDMRKMGEHRERKVTKNVLHTVPASCLAQIGNSKILCGINVEVAHPSAERPECGFIVPNIDASARCANGRRSDEEDAEVQLILIHLEKLLLQCINLEELCIQKGSAAFVLYVDLYCLNNDGALLDLALMAAISALEDVKLPEVTRDDKEELQVDFSKTRPLTLLKKPIALTTAVFNPRNALLLDPTRWELKRAQGQITVVVDAVTKKLAGAVKRGGNRITFDVLRECEQKAHSFIH